MPRLAFTQPADFLKERDFGQKLEATFDFVRAHFKPLGKCLLYIALPVALLSGLANGIFQYYLSSTLLQRSSSADGASSSWSIVSTMVSSPLYVVLTLTGFVTVSFMLLTVYGYMVLRLRNEDPAAEVTVAEVWALVRSRLLGTIGALLGLMVFVGLLASPFFLFVGLAAQQQFGALALVGVLMPFLYMAILYVVVALSLFFIIWVREELGFLATLRRSFYLVWGKWWSTFGLIIVLGIILGLLTSVVVVPVTLTTAWSIFSARESVISPVLTVAANALSTLVMLFMYPIIFIGLAFQYFNLVERKDGEGLRSLVDRIGQPAQPAPLHPTDYYQPDEEGDY
ncbi:hypothetical protein [Hymenobacter crusticola]|uniref:Glycerophosphoryl diester phosphodiesterase membrane domain-containing protein n=1 Tax=Hymenobacter crusticola TaxID=1770526 RepID=A0A243WIE6_9BACT|nr:hypothetical protein [Hymenobacter crusticola]OUJ75595.1 hypothetical protein BXP70_06210 [Hymenobacter crusticola]